MSYRRNDVINPAVITDGFDQVIEDLRSAFEAQLTWLDKAFGRAWLLPERLSDEITYQYPQVYIGHEEYFNVMPNDSYISYCWMIGKGPSFSVEDDLQPFTRQNFLQKRLDIHFFLDLQKIDSSKDYIYTEELVQEVLNVVFQSRGVVVQEVYFETLEDVYEDYTLKEIDRDLLMYPYAGIRIVTSASYKVDCTP